MFLPDVNLWLALTFGGHVHHAVAKQWFDATADGSCFFCRLTQQGFLRLATNRKALGDDAVSLADAWQLFDRLSDDPRVGFATEPAGLEVLWRTYTQSEVFTPKVWNDAYLAAFVRSAGLDIVTFDKGFAAYAQLKALILTAT